ncbi:DUF3592 domain-containing protein [Knoellia sp. LjRoot47]|uniref:DUF3592 domain-containing protein n=1 Tax=Knoellia sp. LjRoot47 TaxID=3342330 RepID=UPI003ECE3813
MSNRFARWANSPRVAGWFLVVAAVGCGFGAWTTWHSATSLSDNGVRTTGEIIEVQDSGRDPYVVIRFRDTNGDDVEAEVGNYFFDPTPRVGDDAEVVYDPADPEGNVADVRMGPDFVAPIFFAVGGLLASALVRPTMTGRIDWDKWRR